MKRRKGEALGDGEGFKNVYYRTIMTTKKERKKWMSVEEELTGGFRFKMKTRGNKVLVNGEAASLLGQTALDVA